MESYDDVYRKPDLYWGTEPNELCNRALSMLLPEGRRDLRAIDLGCGEGRDLIHMARHGLAVTGVDLSRPGLEKAERWVAAEGLALRTAQADLNDYRLDQAYDLVYSSGTLTFLAPERRAELFAHYKAQTRPSGLCAFNVFVEKPYLPTPPDWGSAEQFFRSGELLGYYWDWEVLACEEISFDCNSGGTPHRHAMDVLIARKVG